VRYQETQKSEEKHPRSDTKSKRATKNSEINHQETQKSEEKHIKNDTKSKRATKNSEMSQKKPISGIKPGVRRREANILTNAPHCSATGKHREIQKPEEKHPKSDTKSNRVTKNPEICQRTPLSGIEPGARRRGRTS